MQRKRFKEERQRDGAETETNYHTEESKEEK